LFYTLQLILVLYNALLYAIFRGGIYDYIRLSNRSKTYIKKHRKGVKNYWFYTEINKLNSLGKLYYLNIIFLCYTVLFSAVTITLGYINAVQHFLLIASIGLLFIQIPATTTASIYYSRMEFGKSFVLFARNKETKRLHSSLIDILAWILTAFLIYLSYTAI